MFESVKVEERFGSRESHLFPPLAPSREDSWNLSQYSSKGSLITNLSADRQVEAKIGIDTLLDFHDNEVLLLMYQKPLREFTMEKVFGNLIIPTFKMIRRTGNINPYTDAMLSKDIILYYNKSQII